MHLIIIWEIAIVGMALYFWIFCLQLLESRARLAAGWLVKEVTLIWIPKCMFVVLKNILNLFPSF